MATSTPSEGTQSLSNEARVSAQPVDQEMLHCRALLVSIADSVRHEQGTNTAADMHLINTSLYHLAYNLDVESLAFTNTIVQMDCPGQPTVYKPNVEFHLTLLQCGQILQDFTAEMAKHYFLTVLDPYLFDPGNVLSIPLEAGVASENKVSQLVALALCRLRSGLKVITQIQSVDENESVAYMTNSNAQGYTTRVLEDTSRTVSPLAVYSVHENELAWHNQEAPTPRTLVSDKEYDRSDNSFVTWTEDLDRYAAGSQHMCEQLAFVATMRFTKHADVWWRSLPSATKSQASQNWDSLKHVMQTQLLGNCWYDKQVTIYDEMHYRNRGHEKETPTEWLTWKAFNPTFDSLEVGTIMEHAPPSWQAYMDVDLCHNTNALFTRVKDQEDTLLAISNLAHSRQAEDITEDILR
ncbi:hypothetical protein BS47DRAFT_1399057 [Hydnum rufescens UP504]|uniref:Uncharacterized protein n=1 Tax=Hydnum rufescens UP504 TaxID=1448309 RepID=A0A9P6ALD3_9AGAM|nr:hypothetical protein BS47DRAFT_1399057 [Hydnum rufescens UP504]